MADLLFPKLALGAFEMRHLVIIVCVLGTAIAVAGAWEALRGRRPGIVLQGAAAFASSPRVTQVAIAFFVVRACLLLVVLWTHEVNLILLIICLVIGSAAVGAISHNLIAMARSFAISGVCLCLSVAHAFISGYLALVPLNPPLLALCATLALLALLVSLVAMLGDVRVVLDGPRPSAE